MANKKTDHIEEAEVKTVEEPKVEEPKEELISIMIPLIPGEDPDETVIINGYVTKIKKGETVQVKKNVAEVLENKYQQQKLAEKNRQKFKQQVQEL